MSENLNERGSVSSDGIDLETVADDSEFDDPRVRFFLDYLNLVYGTTAAAFKKGRSTAECSAMGSLLSLAIVNQDNHRKLFEAFLDQPDHSRILVFENSDPLNLSNDFPLQIKSKLICFVKQNQSIVEKDIPIRKQLVIAEFTQTSMSQLALFISQVQASFSREHRATFSS